MNKSDRPQTPKEEDCCGNGCNPCIFDVHKKLLDQWNEKKLQKPKNYYLSPIKYNKFIINDVTTASKDCLFLYLNCESKKEDQVIFLTPSQHLMIKFGSVTKPYTPISWSEENIKLLFKIYPNGAVSNYVKRLKAGDELYVRGPYGEFKYQRNSFLHVIMFSIGSGIAATYPLANSILKDDSEDTKIKMFLGFKSISHVPLKDELRLASDYWNFDCTLYLSENDENTESITGINFVNKRLSIEIIQEILDSYSTESTLILICGTSKFNDEVEKIIIEKKFNNYHVFK